MHLQRDSGQHCCVGSLNASELLCLCECDLYVDEYSAPDHLVYSRFRGERRGRSNHSSAMSVRHCSVAHRYDVLTVGSARSCRCALFVARQCSDTGTCPGTSIRVPIVPTAKLFQSPVMRSPGSCVPIQANACIDRSPANASHAQAHSPAAMHTLNVSRSLKNPSRGLIAQYHPNLKEHYEMRTTEYVRLRPTRTCRRPRPVKAVVRCGRRRLIHGRTSTRSCICVCFRCTRAHVRDAAVVRAGDARDVAPAPCCVRACVCVCACLCLRV